MRAPLLALLIVTAGAGVRPARAAEAPAGREEAAALLRRGASLTEKGDYAGALRAFEEAYARYPSPNIQFNLGATYEALARDARAYGAFQQFLDDPRDAPADTVKRARARLAALRSRIARLTVVSDAAGDRILVDGQARGVTPLAAAIVLDPGPHGLTVTRGQETFTESVTVAAGELRTIAARFAPPPAARPAPLLVVAPPPAPAPAIIASPPAAPAPRPFYRRTWFWVTVGAVVAAGAGAAAFALRETRYPPVDGSRPL